MSAEPTEQEMLSQMCNYGGTLRRTSHSSPRKSRYAQVATTFSPGLSTAPVSRSPKRHDRQTSLSRVAAPRPTKRANRTLFRPKIDNTDSSSQVNDAHRGIFDVMGQLAHCGSRRCRVGVRLSWRGALDLSGLSSAWRAFGALQAPYARWPRAVLR
jgi:hypothetical protein